jgi:hypothetical protein
MLKAYQFMYVSLFKWSYRNFGAGRLPEFKSIFNVSFLLIILLTNSLLVAELLLKSHAITPDLSFATIILFGAVFFMLVNHFILLNNRWFKKLNVQLAHASRHNLTIWSVMLLVNVIITCGFFISTVK